jgi:hypothetical protein
MQLSGARSGKSSPKLGLNKQSTRNLKVEEPSIASKLARYNGHISFRQNHNGNMSLLRKDVQPLIQLPHHFTSRLQRYSLTAVRSGVVRTLPQAPSASVSISVSVSVPVPVAVPGVAGRQQCGRGLAKKSIKPIKPMKPMKSIKSRGAIEEAEDIDFDFDFDFDFEAEQAVPLVKSSFGSELLQGRNADGLVNPTSLKTQTPFQLPPQSQSQSQSQSRLRPRVQLPTHREVLQKTACELKVKTEHPATATSKSDRIQQLINACTNSLMPHTMTHINISHALHTARLKANNQEDEKTKRSWLTSPPLKSGVLWKQKAGRPGEWREKNCRLYEHMFVYYKQENDIHFQGCLQLNLLILTINLALTCDLPCFE